MFPNKTFNNFPRKKRRHNLYSGICVKVDLREIRIFFFKNFPPDSQKKRQNSAKKIIKKSFLEEIL